MPKFYCFTLLIFASLFLSFAFAQDKSDMHSFVKNAVFEGLTKDKFPPDLAKKIEENAADFFVTKCPICTPVQNAFRDYYQSNPQTKRSRLNKTLLKKLISGDKITKQEALRDLINQYVQPYYKKMNFSETEKNKMEQKLANGRKEGMNLKSESFGKFCPSCQGATGAKD